MRWRSRKYYLDACVTSLIVFDTEVGPTGSAVRIYVEDEELANVEEGKQEELIQTYFQYLEEKLDVKRANESSRN
jgi:hypothetical protein